MTTFPVGVIAAAQASMLKWKAPASIALAQFILESADGTKMPEGSNNPFGIKAGPGQPFVSCRTREQRTGGEFYYVVAKFRKFANWAEAFDQHGMLLALAKPYHDMMTTFIKEYSSDPGPTPVRELAHSLKGVYATALKYDTVLDSIMDEGNLYQYDVPFVSTPRKVTMAMTTPAAPAATPYQISLKIGDALEVLLTAADAVVPVAITAAESFIPSSVTTIASLIGFGPAVLEGYIHNAIAAAKAAAPGEVIPIAGNNSIINMAVTAFNNEETVLAGAFGTVVGSLESWVSSRLTSIAASKVAIPAAAPVQVGKNS